MSFDPPSRAPADEATIRRAVDAAVAAGKDPRQHAFESDPARPDVCGVCGWLPSNHTGLRAAIFVPRGTPRSSGVYVPPVHGRIVFK